jgi:cytochrome P450
MNPDDIAFSFADQNFLDDPTSVMALLRDKCPVHHTIEPSAHFTLTRGEDVTAALRDEKTWSSKFGPGLAYSEPGVGVLVSSDPPVHTQERIAISRIFKGSVIENMEKEIADLTEQLIDDFEENMSGDIIKEFAAPIPLTVMCWLLGTPTTDIGLFRSWVLPMAESVAYSEGREASAKVKAAYQDFFEYFSNHIEERKDILQSGGDVPEDLLTRLLSVTNDGKKLSTKKILGFCQFLLVAGSETTTLMIGNVLHQLMENPRQFELLKSKPELIPNAIEESLRFDAPVHGLFRTNTEETTIHGVRVPADSKVCMMFGSANRDPNLWVDPDVFDISRDPTNLRNHASFGVGSHYCLGAPLSRLEGKVALKAIIERLPKIRTNGLPTQTTAGVLKGFASLPVRWD